METKTFNGQEHPNGIDKVRYCVEPIIISYLDSDTELVGSVIDLEREHCIWALENCSIFLDFESIPPGSIFLSSEFE